ncbi:MAG: PIG-L deacetylase family protein [Parcubacteria group bacterium]
MKNNILVIAAHPDDEVLGCGGTIAKYVREGSKVYCLFLGRGKASRNFGKKPIFIKKEQIILEKETQKAAKILGISEIFFENFPDQQYDRVPLLKIVKAIEKLKEKIKPEIVFSHHSGDLNKDHRLTCEAVMTAFRPLPKEKVKAIYFFETPSSTEWGIPKRKNYFAPNIFIDISNVFQKKKKALQAYKSEIRSYPHPRSLRGIEIIARRWGMASGKNLAEAFELLREIKD